MGALATLSGPARLLFFDLFNVLDPIKSLWANRKRDCICSAGADRCLGSTFGIP